MAETFQVQQRSKLLVFLFNALSGWSKKKVKQRLQNANISVNGVTTSKHDFIIEVGDVVEVDAVPGTFSRKTSVQTLASLEILYQDKDLIAINKPAGLLSVGTTQETKQHALALLRKQLSRAKEMVKLWPVHRLDRETSGVLLFATSKEVREGVMDKWGVSEKTYLAIVKGTPKESTGTINEPLRLDETEYRMHVGAHKDSKAAITHYKVLESKNGKSLLEVRIETGRQHQIRAHMAWLGHSIVGDERYGTIGHKMGLHALRLSTIHPKSKKTLELTVDAPSDFYKLLLSQ